MGYFRNRKLKQLRAQWQSPKTWDREFSSIRILFDLTRPSSDQAVVDDKTWHDLDMDSVFRKVDSTITSVGQQYLYRKLRLLQDSNSRLEDDFKVVTTLKEDRDLREALQLNLSMLKQGDAKLVSKTLFDTIPAYTFPKLAIFLWSLLSLSTLFFAAYLGGAYLFLILPIVIANFSISRYFEGISDGIADILYYLYNLVSISERIAKLELSSKIPACKDLENRRSSIAKVKKVMRRIAISQSSENLLVNNAMYLLNLTFPYDFLVYSLSIKSIVSETEVMKACYLAVASIDSSISTASYINRNDHLCNPTLISGDAMELEDAYHPLVDNYVANSFSTQGPSVLVTGSNMAGKTTFIKTIGVNVIFARSLWICHATQARIPLVDVYSSIKTEDGLIDGKSFYFSELERLKTFIEMAGAGKKCLFLIDEIYRGTNTIERIAGAAAVLQELANGNLVFVTTHDIELASMLDSLFEQWHFEETGNINKPFDYKLKPGVCRTRNALKLMASMGYPEHVTDRAKRFAINLDAEH